MAEHPLFTPCPLAPAETGGESRPLFAPGSFCRPAGKETVAGLGLPHPHDWNPADEDWRLPENWEAILKAAFRDRLRKYRSLRVFMDICVRCGACADKCHFFLGTGDPGNMPVLRAELLRSVYRGEFTVAGRLLGKAAGSRRLNAAVVKEWFAYFYQCTECRRCALFCPYGIDTAEITMIARELLLELGLGINWILEPVANCARSGNHLGLQPQVFRESVRTLCEDIRDITGVNINPPCDEKGHEVLFVAPSGDLYAEPGIYTFMGYLMLFQAVGLDYTLSTRASEGGNFGLFASAGLARKVNAGIYAEAERLGVRWILGGECGHMWRVAHQYMDSMNGPAPAGLETPRSPVTGTVFRHAASAKMIHIAEFSADLVHHGKLRLDPGRNESLIVTFHDSCNPARAMGLLEEPRAVLRAACTHFVEMPENTIRERTFCCGSGAGLNSDEILSLRLQGGLPRGHALRHVQRRNKVNTLACICAIDRVSLRPLAKYWAPGVRVAGLHELLGNALILPGEGERRLNLRQEPLPGAPGYPAEPFL
ncbi:MAG: (Fe-S)-binding protein [Desulfovibrio sp.]|jgi:Fe-S oxidoreductase|nr:(Fe-S)-binding protein [Desulfovibrio sp.]